MEGPGEVDGHNPQRGLIYRVIDYLSKIAEKVLSAKPSRKMLI